MLNHFSAYQHALKLTLDPVFFALSKIDKARQEIEDLTNNTTSFHKEGENRCRALFHILQQEIYELYGIVDMLGQTQASYPHLNKTADQLTAIERSLADWYIRKAKQADQNSNNVVGGIDE